MSSSPPPPMPPPPAAEAKLALRALWAWFFPARIKSGQMIGQDSTESKGASSEFLLCMGSRHLHAWHMRLESLVMLPGACKALPRF